MDFAAQPQQAQTSAFPPLKQLFKVSWDNLISKLLPILIFNGITLGIIIAATVIIFLLLAGSVSLGNISSLATNPLLTSVPVLLLVVVWFIALIILFSIMQIGNVLILSSNSNQIYYKGLFQQSLHLILPVLIANLISAFFVIGGFFLFVIPAFIFAIFFQFVVYLVILDKLSPLNALKRSVYLVTKSFGPFFIRLLVIVLIPLGVSMILGFFSDQDPYGILNSIFSIFYSFFSISYMINLFKQTKAASGEGMSSLKIMAILSAVGWILGIILLVLIARTAGTISSTLNTPPLPLNNTFPEGFEDEFLFEDDLLLSTPSASALPTTRPATNSAVRVSTSSGVTP